MESSEVKTLYTCIVCGKGFSSRKALFGHMRVHRDVKFKRVTVRLPAELVDRFYDVVRKHKTTSCSVLHGLITAVVQGEELGVVKLQGPNPFIVQLNSYFGARPRGHGKYDFGLGLGPEPRAPGVLCLFMDGVDGDQVFCQKRGGLWLPLSVCSTCPKNRFQKKGEV
jgi:hypothetical protein